MKNRIETVKNDYAEGVSYEWDSYEDFLDDFEELKVSKPYYAATCRHDNMGSSANLSWYGHLDGFDGMIRATNDGWPEMREKVVKMVAGIELDLPIYPTMSSVRRRKRIRGDNGDSIDMQRVWNGQLDTAWSRPQRVNRNTMNTKRVTLSFNISTGGHRTNDQAMWRAALCMLLTDSLARAGRTMEVWIVDTTRNPFTSSGAPKYLWTGWMVKGSSDPLFMDRLCAMVSVGFMRTNGFMAEGMGPWNVCSGFGGAADFGLPATLNKRRAQGELVIRIGDCFDKHEVLQAYKRAWREVEAHAQEAA